MTVADFLTQLETLLVRQDQHLQAEQYEQAGDLASQAAALLSEAAQAGPVAGPQLDRLNRLAALCRRNCLILAERKAHLAAQLAHSTRGRSTLRAYSRNQ